MQKFSLLTVLLFSLNIFHVSAQQSISIGSRPADYEYLAAPDSLGIRLPLKMPSISRANGKELPYPIVFIHGLNSYSNTWNITTDFMDAQYGTGYGGRIDYCLNSDANNTTANIIGGTEVLVWTPTLVPADYYYVNFDVGTDGSFHPNGSIYDVISNQSAISKQGLAVRNAVERVLQITGKEKVILMGHSMGGLAAREYLQNTNLWQPDGQHHVAKLVTTGTPHYGSNQVTGGAALSGVDCQSEAYRDLRTSYSGSSSPGVYLFGGAESNSVMNLSFCSNFYNINVNCNGTVGDNIQGLNYKNIYTNLDYSCIIGECTGCGGASNTGDGIVTDYSANLNNIYPGLNANLFHYYGSAIVEIHTDLPEQNLQNMEGLDEPDKYDLAYHVGLDTTYMGFVTLQANNNPNYPTDRDEYKFNISSTGSVNINVGSIIIASDFTVNLLNSSYQIIGTAFHPAGSTQSINFTRATSVGDYFLEIISDPTANSYLNAYNFTITYVPCTFPTVDFSFNATNNNVTFTNLSQNAQTYTWSFGDGSSSTLANPGHSYVSTGTYTVSLTASNPCGSQTITKTVTIGCQPITANFSSSVTGNTVQFTNTSQNSSNNSWNFGDGSGSALQNPSHTYSSPGTYTVILTVANSCSTQTASRQVVIVATGINEIAYEKIKLYPNPTNSILTIEASFLQGSTIEIYNVYGQLVLTVPATQETRRVIDISSLSAGMYRIRTDNSISEFVKY